MRHEEVDTCEEYTYYGKGGVPVEDKELSLLYEYSYSNPDVNQQSKYYVKTFDGQLYNPLETMPARYARVEFTKVSEDVFDKYLEYLAHPDMGAFNKINRLVMYKL